MSVTMAFTNIINISSLFMLIFPALILAEPRVPCFFIFGDSIVDNGNNNNLQSGAKVNYLPYGIDFPAGPSGRFSNGRNLADFIAQLLGFEKSIAPFSNATNEDIIRGLNYASGGAGILPETGSVFGKVVTLNEQLSHHLTTITTTAEILRSISAAKQHLNSCLYYVGLGNNDYLANYLPQYYSKTAKDTPQQFANDLVTQYSKQLQKLYDYGARKVAVFGAGKLGCVPQQVMSYGATNGSRCHEPSNQIVKIFNDNLRTLINDFNNRHTDSKFLYVYYADHPSICGNFKNLNTPCCATSAKTFGQCAVGGATCSNRNEYCFWDQFHPTEAASFNSAKVAVNYLSPLLV